MASQYLARLGIVLGVDSGELVQGITDAKKQFHNFAGQVEKDTKAAAREFEALKNATEDYGKTLTKVEQIQREIDRGRFMFASQNVKDKLLEQAKAYDAQAASMKKVAGAMTDQQKLQVSYQLTDFFTQIASGQNALIAFVQQGGQLKDSMGGIGNAFSAVLSFLSPMKVGLAAVAGYFGAIAYAAYKADQELDKFNDTIALTGNFSGITISQFEKLSREMAKASDFSISNAKDALMELVSSGKFTEQSIDAVQRAVLTFARVTGTSGAEAAKQLQSGLSGSASEAKALNDKMNFLTLEQYKHIEALENAGKKQEAAREVSIALTTQLELQARQVGALEGTWKKLTKTVSDWFEKTKEELREPTIKENLAAIDKQIETMQNRMNDGGLFSILFKSGSQKIIDSLVQTKDNLQEIERIRARAKAAKEVGQNAKSEIDDESGAGGIAKRLQMAAQLEKTRNEIRIENAKVTADEIGRIRLDAEKKIFDKQKDYDALSGKEKRALGKQYEEQLNADIEQIRAERDRKIADARYKQYLKELDFQIAALHHQEELDKALNQKKIDAELEVYRAVNKAKDEEKNKTDILRMQMDLIGATEKEKNIAEEKLRIEKEIAEWKRSEQYGLLSQKDQTFYEEQKRQISDAKIANMELAESLRYVQGMYDAVWSNMASAIEKFVRTGKLSIKDLTRSIIQDMLIMNMKLQAMTLLRSMFSMFSGFAGGANMKIAPGTVGDYNTLGSLSEQRAVGGSVSAGSPYIVGERGPELFMPTGSGTIIPNNMLGSGGVTNVTNNYINAIDAKSFEQRLLESNQAIWSANQYATKNMATNFGRT